MSDENIPNNVRRFPKLPHHRPPMDLAHHAKAMGLSDVVILARDEKGQLQILTLEPMRVSELVHLLEYAKNIVMGVSSK